MNYWKKTNIYTAINRQILQDFISASLESFSNRSNLPSPKQILKEFDRIGIDVDDELKKRNLFDIKTAKQKSPSRVIHIVGAPRSGTSFLYYSLIHSRVFAYFTSESHHRWCIYNLAHSTKKKFEDSNAEILAVNTKKIRMKSDLDISK